MFRPQTSIFWFLCLLGTVSSVDDAESSASGLRRSLTIMPKEIQEYFIFSSKEIEDRLQRWSAHYTDLTRLTTAQDEYDLPRAGGPDDCPFLEDDGCQNSILTIQDFVAHPEGSDSSNRLPEVLWSGEVHGNEQVGPTAVMQAAELLLEAASCLALPRLELKDDNPYEWNADVEKAKECRQDLEDYGFSEKQVWWLGRLVSTRRIVVVPTANALGYYRKRREEGMTDPNRDFPFDYKVDDRHPEFNTRCMQTIAARTLNEVFREHMFQLSLTFHGGMEVIGYEWGAPTYGKINISPDDTVQSQIAAAYSRYAGGWQGTKPYAYGAMNKLVYPVRGGMEDWAYAGSWDPDRVIPCKPTTYTEYPVERTQYDQSTLRVLNMLVETSNHKIPTDNLGTSWDLIKGFSVAGNGHISRNIRLALLAAELVEPWLAVRQVNELELTDDVIPLMDRTGKESCQKFKVVTVPEHSRKVVIEWTVGGCLTINDTKLWYAKWSDVADLNCMDQPPLNIVELMKEGTPISSTSGQTRFASTSSARTAHFSASMDVSGFNANDKIVVLVSARVDQDWAQQPNKFEPDTTPQSHMANVRTNADWYHKSGDKVIQGRLDWFSSPLTILVRGSDDSMATLEPLTRIPLPAPSLPPVPSSSPVAAGKPGRQPTGEQAKQPDAWTAIQRLSAGVVTLMLITFVVIVGRCVMRERMRYGQRSRVREFIEDESAPSPGERHTADIDEDDQPDGERYSDQPNDKEEQNGVEMGRYSYTTT